MNKEHTPGECRDTLFCDCSKCRSQWYNKLKRERDELQKSLDALCGAKFSDRVHAALKSRAETAEAENERLKDRATSDRVRYGDLEEQSNASSKAASFYKQAGSQLMTDKATLTADLAKARGNLAELEKYGVKAYEAERDFVLTYIKKSQGGLLNLFAPNMPEWKVLTNASADLMGTIDALHTALAESEATDE